MIPFDSWDGNTDLASTVEQTKLEQHIGTGTVVFGSYQTAVSAVLEVLGSRSHLIPVVLPITASPDVIGGVLRAGADPLLLDIRPQTLQIDPEALREVLTELEAAVVVLNRPAGQPVDPELLSLTAELPTILDSRLPPHEAIGPECTGTFSLFDLGPVVGSGAAVVHKFNQQVHELKMVRNGILGLACNLNDVIAAVARKRLLSDPALTKRRETQATVAASYIALLREKYVFPWDTSPEWPYFVVRVENADRAIAHLHSAGISAMKPVFPLHMLSDVNRRWVEKPSYPVAEGLWKKLIALPTHLGILGQESKIVSILSEVAND